MFLGPPGTGKTHLSIGLGIRACQAGRLADTHHAGRLQQELVELGRVPLIIVDEVVSMKETATGSKTETWAASQPTKTSD